MVRPLEAAQTVAETIAVALDSMWDSRDDTGVGGNAFSFLPTDLPGELAEVRTPLEMLAEERQ